MPNAVAPNPKLQYTVLPINVTIASDSVHHRCPPYWAKFQPKAVKSSSLLVQIFEGIFWDLNHIKFHIPYDEYPLSHKWEQQEVEKPDRFDFDVQINLYIFNNTLTR